MRKFNRKLENSIIENPPETLFFGGGGGKISNRLTRSIDETRIKPKQAVLMQLLVSDKDKKQTKTNSETDRQSNRIRK